MPAECESLRLRLRIEYTRLLDWGNLASLSEEHDHHSFDRKLQSNRATIIMILSEMRSLLKTLRKISLIYTEIKSKRKDKKITSDAELASDMSATFDSEDKIQMFFQGVTIVVNSIQEIRDFALFIIVITIDLEFCRDFFKSRKLFFRTRRQRTTGLNHVIKLSQGLKNIVMNPRRIV